MSKQPFVITPKNCPRPLKVLREHAILRKTGERMPEGIGGALRANGVSA
jgi:hypothetical protein